MANLKQAALVLCLILIASASLKAEGLLGKQLSGIENSILNDGILNDSIINRQTDILNKRITELKNKAEQQFNTNELLTALPDGEVSSLILPVSRLTDVIDIVDSAGKTVFRDVEVENGWRAIEQQWLVMSSESELKQLQQLAQDKVIKLVKKQSFSALSLTLVQFKVNALLDNKAKLQAVLPSSLQKKLSRDYVYQTQLVKTASETHHKTRDKIGQEFQQQAIKESLSHAVCLAPLTIGMVDTAIDARHHVFNHKGQSNNENLIKQSFVEMQLTSPKAHGTAVSALFISQDPQLPALLPHAKLFAAEVFYRQNDFSQGANLFNLVAGINWLLTKKVSVINMSLAGPDNTILAAVITSAIEKNTIIVAAVGNEGPHSPPLYPAAYKDVIGVTAIDKNNKLYRWANRGGYVDFSALGVSVKTARLSGDFGYESGTSIAAPVISAYAACAQHKVREQTGEQQDENTTHYWPLLIEQVVDLGEKGHDPLFGHGRLGL